MLGIIYEMIDKRVLNVVYLMMLKIHTTKQTTTQECDHDDERGIF